MGESDRKEEKGTGNKITTTTKTTALTIIIIIIIIITNKFLFFLRCYWNNYRNQSHSWHNQANTK
jgi:hypothetical protein